MRISPGKLARLAALAYRIYQRASRDRCLGCGERPEPLSLLCAACEKRVREYEQRRPPE